MRIRLWTCDIPNKSVQALEFWQALWMSFGSVDMSYLRLVDLDTTALLIHVLNLLIVQSPLVPGAVRPIPVVILSRVGEIVMSWHLSAGFTSSFEAHLRFEQVHHQTS